MGHNRTRRGVARPAGTRDGAAGAHGATGEPYGPGTPYATVADRGWAAEVRSAVLCAVGLFGLVLLIDWANGTLDVVRACLWAPLSALLYLVLHPVRVTAGPGWLAVRGLGRRKHVCTNLLTAVRHSEGVAARLVLCDSLGNRVELDPRILVDNPLLLHRLDTGARAARDAGLLRTGCAELRRLTERADGAAAKAVFEASDLS
ncbi:hypothetical protein [Streptomyces sp. NPDC029674]|uniref:hypothetical protein n=1 Tax=Streptomyces sp. NPDC029674 TaxID=3365297 RepID=UPI00384DD112